MVSLEDVLTLDDGSYIRVAPWTSSDLTEDHVVRTMQADVHRPDFHLVR